MSNAPSQPQPTSTNPLPTKRPTFSLASILVITFVVAFIGAVLSHMFRAINDQSPVNMGYFALAAALGPSVILIVAGTAFNVFRLIKSYQNPVTVGADSEESQ